MSAKVLSKEEASGAELMLWPSLDGFAPPPGIPLEAGLTMPVGLMALSAGSMPSPASTPETSARILQLEQQVEAVKLEAERRVQDALEEGRRTGEAAAREALSATLNTELERLKTLSDGLLATAPALRKQAEADLVRLAVAIARRILHREISLDNEALLGLVKAALAKIDQREVQLIRTHPDNVRVLERVLEQSLHHRRVQISGDERLDRGSLLIETSRGQMDASVETHLEEIERGFTDLVGNRG